MKFSRQEYWSELPFPFARDLPDPGIKPGAPALQADSLLSELKVYKLTLLMWYKGQHLWTALLSMIDCRADGYLEL